MSEVITTPETEAAALAPKVVLTKRERLTAKYATLLAKHDAILVELHSINAEVIAIDALESVAVGTEVLVSIGRAETARTVAGTVVGVREDDNGTKSYKVQYGSGFDADIVVVKSCSIALPAEGVGE